MKVGSKVRVTGIPEGLEDYPDSPTKSTFIKCVGREFVIAGFNEVGMAELDISSVNGSVGEKIWIEPQFLELVSKWPTTCAANTPTEGGCEAAREMRVGPSEPAIRSGFQTTACCWR